jgi:hypothetical protein
MWSEWVGVLVAMSFAMLVFVAIAPLVETLYSALTAPLGTVAREPESQIDVPFTRGALLLFSLYFGTGVIFSLTGGTAGFLATTASINAIPVSPAKLVAGLRCGFIVGVLFTGAARLRGATATTVLADQLAALATITAGLAVFIIFYGAPSQLSFPQILQYAHQNLFTDPVKAVATAFAAMVIVEILVILTERFSTPFSRQLSRATLRQRIEQHDTVEQVFWHRRVETVTDRVIRDEIKRDGVQSICWMTNTAPPCHGDVIHEAACSWTQAHATPGVVNSHDLAATLIKANLRVIVPSRDVLEQITANLPWVRRCRVTNGIFRTRLMILNGKVAIVHLPIPFRKTKGEQSNFAAIIRGIDGVHEIQSWFDTVWENCHDQEIQEYISEMLAKGDAQACTLLMIVAEMEHGIRKDNAIITLKARGFNPSDGDVDLLFKDFQARGLVAFDAKTNLFYPARRQTVGSMLDSLARVVSRHAVFNHAF